jgi:PST family polysaccharide transporter
LVTPASSASTPAGPSDGEHDDGLRAKVGSGLRWSALDQVVQQVMRLAVTVTLTHLIAPREFGLVGLAFVFSEFGSMLGDVGMGPALVHRRDLTERHIATSFTTGGAVGLALAGLLTLAAHPLARFFDEPRLQPVLVVLSLNFLFKGLTGTSHYLLRRALQFRPFVICYALGVAIGGATGIVLAFANAGVWALVAYALTESFVGLVAAVVYTTRLGLWRPRLGFDRRAARDMLGFGASVSGTRLLVYGRQNLDNLLVGKELGATALGLYNLAYRIMLYPIQRVGDVVSSVAFPAFATIQHDRARMGSGFVRSLRTICLVVFPLSIGSMVTAPTFVPLLFGSKWTPAVATVQILALNGPRLALNGLNGSILQAIGRPSLDLALNLVLFVASAIAFVIGVQYGIEAVAWGFTIVGFLLLPLSISIIMRALSVRSVTLFGGLAPITVATAGMAAATWGAGRAVGGAPDAVRLAVMVAAGPATYVAVLGVSARNVLVDAVDDVFRRA